MDDDTPDEFGPEQVKLSTPASSTRRQVILTNLQGDNMGTLELQIARVVLGIPEPEAASGRPR